MSCLQGVQLQRAPRFNEQIFFASKSLTRAMAYNRQFLCIFLLVVNRTQCTHQLWCSLVFLGPEEVPGVFQFELLEIVVRQRCKTVRDRQECDEHVHHGREPHNNQHQIHGPHSRGPTKYFPKFQKFKFNLNGPDGLYHYRHSVYSNGIFPPNESERESETCLWLRCTSDPLTYRNYLSLSHS